MNFNSNNGKLAWKKVVSNGMTRNDTYAHYDSAIKSFLKSFLRAAEAQLVKDLMYIENQIRRMSPAEKAIRRGHMRAMMLAPAQIRRTLAFVQMQLSKL